MPVIRVSDPAFAQLSSLKTWFGTKTPGDTIEKLIRDAMDQLGIERDDELEETVAKTSTGAMAFEAAPSLTFTKPLTAVVNGKVIDSPRWSAILLAVIAQVKARGFEGEKLVHELQVPAKTVKYEGEGFKYHADLGVSIQGQSASDAWKETDRLAQKWGIPVAVDFFWRSNAKAQHPGKKGALRSGETK